MARSSRHLRTPAMLAALVVISLGAASSTAARGAVTAAQPFELVYSVEYSWESQTVGAFTSKAPFCESGSVVDVDRGVRRFACADGSGSMTLGDDFPQARFDGHDWRVVEGTDQYAGLRGKGTFSEELLGDDAWPEGLRVTFQGVVAEDAVAPTIAFASAQASRVIGKKGVYTMPIALDIRDNVEDNPVACTVSVRRESGAGPWLASKSGEAIGGISFELRVRRPNAQVRAVLIRTTAVDPVGNESSLDAMVTLPK